MRASPHDWQGPVQCPGQAPSRWSRWKGPRVHPPCRPHSVTTMLFSGFTRLYEWMVSWNDERVTKNNTTFCSAVSGSCISSLRLIRLALSGAVRMTSASGAGPLTSGSRGLVQAVCSTRRHTWPAHLPTIIRLPRFLQRLGLGPRRHTEEQHFSQCPDVIRQSGCHRGRPRLPHPSGAPAVGCLRSQ